MCKHVAAVLYGVGARLDEQPELLFSLRRVDAKDLVTQAGAGLPKARQGPAAGKVLDDAPAGRCVWHRDDRCRSGDETSRPSPEVDGNQGGYHNNPQGAHGRED